METTPITVFNYKEAGISFRADDGTVMINATQMTKPFGKRPNDWLSLPSTKDFLMALSNTRKSCISRLIVTRRGNSNNKNEHGTWMHEDVALEFARWLSPMFAIWCNDHIKELLTRGHTSVRNPARSLEEMFATTAVIADNMKRELAEGKIVPQEPGILLNSNDIVLYTFLRNGIAGSINAPFYTNDVKISSATGLTIDEVLEGWERLERGNLIIRRPDGNGGSVFILGSRQP